MKRTIKSIAIVSVLLSCVFVLVHRGTQSSVVLSLAISCGTTAYHFCMRLAVGTVYDLAFHNKVNPYRKWFTPRNWEKALYKTLRVKKWKGRMPSYAPDNFDTKQHSLKEIAGAMCQAEIVHETIVLLSFLPIAATAVWGEFMVFLLTSLAAAAFDMAFVIMQRYNRPRIMKLMERKSQVSKNNTPTKV